VSATSLAELNVQHATHFQPPILPHPPIHLQQTFPRIPAHSLQHPANHESLRPRIASDWGQLRCAFFRFLSIPPHHLTTFVPTQRETISERACRPNQLGRISERVYSPSQLRTILERSLPRKMLKEKIMRIRTARLMTSLRVSTAGVRQIRSRLRCQ
jgi:hypothetical protein